MEATAEVDRLQVAFADRYRIKERLGAGGMATVYLAEDLKHRRDLAIKVLKPELAAVLGPARFRREIDIAAKLNHPHIVALIDSGEASSFLYYVMPYVEGDSLRARLSREKQLPLEQALRITEQVASALDYAHRQGIVHRDIKPENILLFQGEALVTDFGIALAVRTADEARLTETGLGIGTPQYMSPEQATGERELDARSDVYSLACVLYECLVGEPPYTGATARAVLVRSLLDTVPSARRLRESIPPSIDGALRRALAKDPGERFAGIAEFAAALRAKGAPSNLPSPPTAIIGRQRELADARTLLRLHRLVTLTGPGGSGKTRLALHIATQAASEFSDGVFWVPLQAIRDHALVEGAVTAAMGTDDGLAEHIGSKSMLILLDNFEHVLDAAPLVSSLLLRAPNAKILVTSREPLHLEGEHRFPVEPLPSDDAAALFIERAKAIAPDFSSSAAVDEICRRLDGLPLAIELAAARVALLDADELLARLERRLPLLASHSRDAPARQRTLRSAIKWSDELLGSAEQQLFYRLSAFAGTFTMKAAEIVADADVDGLESLVVKSLVRRSDGGRFGMLETIREYALERLEDTSAAPHVHRRHAEYFLRVAESANLNAGRIAAGGMQLSIAMEEQENIRAALGWALASGSVELGLQLAIAMEVFWVVQNPREGMRWFAALFAHPNASSVAVGWRAHGLRAFGSCTDVAGDDTAADQLYQQSFALFDQLEDPMGRAVLLHRLAIQAMRRGDLAAAQRLVEESHEIHCRLDDKWGMAQTTGAMGAIARDGGDTERAHTMLRRSAALSRQAGGFSWWEGGMLAELAMLALHGNDVEEAASLAFRSLTLAEATRDRPGRVLGVGILATVAAERGQAEHAGRLWGAIEGDVSGAPLGGWRRHRAACEARLLSAAGPDFERAVVEGRSLSLDAAVRIALTPS